MDTFIRIIAIFIEVVILAAVIYSLLTGVWFIIFNLGIAARYKKVVTMMMVMVGVISVIFFIAHLSSFYPGGTVQ